MRVPADRESRRGFTLVEMLVVVAIIGVLAAILIPTIGAARRHVKEGLTRTELSYLQAALVEYYTDWGEYPPDLTGAAPFPAEQNLDPAQCLVYYLRGPTGIGFRTDMGFTSNGGPYFDFPADRLDSDGRFLDALGPRPGVTYYQFDNNEADGGGESWGPGNVSNVHPMSVDIWSAGWDGVDQVSSAHPTQDNVTTLDLGDDIGNW